MNRRDLIRMNDEEIRAFLEEQRIVQVASIDHNGWPHLVAMWYRLITAEEVFWTYANTQKPVNLRLQARLPFLHEDAGRYYQSGAWQQCGNEINIKSRS